MKYYNAEKLLPEALADELKRYVQGGYIYVPADGRKPWGEVSGYRRELAERDSAIAAQYRAGVTVKALSERYCLSEHAVRKIIYRK